MDCYVKILYTEPKTILGILDPFYVDYIRFDSIDEAEKFLQGEKAFNFLDDAVRLRNGEQAICLYNENGVVLWEDAALKTSIKVIDYLKFNQFSNEPFTPGEKVAEYLISRIHDYYEDCEDGQLFQKAFIGQNDYSNMRRFYNLMQNSNLEEIDDYSKYTYQMLNTTLNANIIANLEKACSEHYDTLFSSDIEFLLSDEPYDDVIQHCNIAPQVNIEGVILRALTEEDLIQVEVLDEMSYNNVAESLDADEYAWGLFLGEELIGYCTLGGADDPQMGYEVFPEWTSESLCLSDVFIKPSYRGEGLAQKLVNEVLETANPEKQSVFLTLLDNNLSALYEKAGFYLLKEGVMVRKERNQIKVGSLDAQIDEARVQVNPITTTKEEPVIDRNL